MTLDGEQTLSSSRSVMLRPWRVAFAHFHPQTDNCTLYGEDLDRPLMLILPDPRLSYTIIQPSIACLGSQ